jgi:catecholate siderophore receptor
MKNGWIFPSLLLVATVLSWGQDTGGALTGTIYDASGAIVSGALVTLRSNVTPVKSIATDMQGRYMFAGLPRGEYRLTAVKEGFDSVIRTATVTGKRVEMNVTIMATPVRQSVTITEHLDTVVGATTAGTKTLTPLRDIPQSIQIVGRELLQSQAALSMQDALRGVSGVSMHLGEGRRDQVYIRGNNAVRDMYVDGVRDDAAYYRDLSNTEQVEVVKGPASVLFGRGTSGGLVNRVTKKPQFERPLLDVSLVTGSYGAKRLGADLGLPLLDNKLAFRLNGATEESGSHRHYFFLKRYSVAPALSWRPTERTQVLAQVEQLSDERLPDRGIPSWNGHPAPVAVGLYYGYPGKDLLTNQVTTQALTAEHRITDRVTVRNVFRHSNYRNAHDNTYPSGISIRESQVWVSRGQYNASTRQENYFDQAEVVATRKQFGLTHTILAGFEAGDQSTRGDRFNGSAAAVDLFHPFLTRPIYAAAPATLNAFGGRTYGVYAQDQVSIGAGWKALIGIRRDYYRQELNDLTPRNFDLGRTDRAWSPRGGLVYQPSQWLALYGSYSRSFIPSGDGLALAANNADLKPETSENYEVGAKMDLIGGRLSANAAIFRLDRNNIKTTDPVDPSLLVLVGKQRTSGVEFSIAGSPVRRWNIHAAYAWLDPRIVRSNDVASGVRVEGNVAGHIPAHSANFWSTYTFENGFGFGGGVTFNGDRFTSNDNLVVLPAYHRLDATLFYRRRHYEAALNLRNLFNASYYESAHGNFTIYPGAPINGLLTLRYRW